MEREADLVVGLLTRRGKLEQFEAILLDILKVVSEMSLYYRGQKRATKKRNWRAASVAGSCRDIWTQEHCESQSLDWQKFCSGKGREMSEAQRLQRFAPTTEKQDAPGPFGRFLRDVLEALDVRADDGGPVSEKTALDSWRNASHEQTRKF